MKYENRLEAMALCGRIEKIDNKLSLLSGMYNTVTLTDNLSNKIATVGTDPGSEHELAPLAKKFKEDVVNFYTELREQLIRDLEQL